MTDAAVSSARSYRKGSWFGILGDTTTVLLPPNEKARVASLWELADEGAGFDELLDALIIDGLRALPAFALMDMSDGLARVLLRGDTRAVLHLADGRSVELGGGDSATWVERTLSDVASVCLVVDDPGQAADLEIDGGLVRLARVDQPPRVANRPSFAPAADPASVDEVAPLAEPVAAPSPLSWADPLSDPLPAVEAILAQPTASTPSAPQPSFDPLDVDHDGHTVSGGWDPSRFAPRPPGTSGQPPAASVTSMPVARLVFSSGQTVDVDRAVLVGRAPEARRYTSNEQPLLVTVPSPNQEISSTHLEVRPGSGADHGSAVVTDMGSTNGSVLTLPGLVAEDLQPGIAVQVVPGSLIDLGDGVTIHVAHP